MARIRHIALTTKDPEKTAAFYMQAFGMQEVSRYEVKWSGPDGVVLDVSQSGWLGAP
jgi:hypothetical protein